MFYSFYLNFTECLSLLKVSFKLTRESKKVILDQKQSNGRNGVNGGAGDGDSAPPAAPRRSPNGFILPDPLPKGHRLIDNRCIRDQQYVFLSRW